MRVRWERECVYVCVWVCVCVKEEHESNWGSWSNERKDFRWRVLNEDVLECFKNSGQALRERSLRKNIGWDSLQGLNVSRSLPLRGLTFKVSYSPEGMYRNMCKSVCMRCFVYVCVSWQERISVNYDFSVNHMMWLAPVVVRIINT